MSDVAIQVEGIGKRYRIGREQRTNNFREAIMRTVTSPLRRIRNPLVPDGDDIFWALKDVSFNVRRGEVIGVIGRNGAGKSTLLKILSRITEPTEGQAIINGRVGSLLEVGTGFHPELTGRENVYLNGAILGMKRGEIDKKFDEIVAFSEIEKFLDTPVKHYSSGMYMRLAFAVAAHLDPEILIVDEVLAVGDAEFQKKCLGKMQDVAGQGRTVLFVSHNMNAIERLCTSALLLQSGKTRRYSTDVRTVIKEYEFADADPTQLSCWTNNGSEFANPFFMPMRIDFTDEQGNVLRMPVSNDAPAWVRIQGRVTELDPTMAIGFGVYSEEGHLLYRSFQNDGRPEVWRTLALGFCVFRAKLPPHFFNEGVYRIELLASRMNPKWLFHPGISSPRVYLTIRGGLSESPAWLARREGLLAPVLEWSAPA